VVLLAATCILGIVGCSASKSPAAIGNGPPPAANVTQPQSTPVGRAAEPAALPTIASTITPVPTVAAAIDLTQQTLDGKPLTTNDWSLTGVVVIFRAPAVPGAALVPQIEVAKLGQPFQGVPTTQGPPVPATTDTINAQIPLTKLAPGQYTWQARFQDAETKQAGAWTGFANGQAAFGIVDSAPSVQGLAVTGTRHTIDSVPAVGPNDQPGLSWAVSTDQPLAIDHLAYLADHQEKAPALAPAKSTVLPAGSQSAPLPTLDDGTWYVHLWALDKAGQSSPPQTVAVSIMRTAVHLDDVLYRSWATNPLYQSVPIHFTVSRAANVTISILPSASTDLVRSFSLGRQPARQQIGVNWDGKDSKGKIVAPGSYRFLVDTVDDVGNQTQALYSGINISDKVIKVSLGTQSLTAYEGNKPFLTTPVTSGGADIPTPTGQFEIIEKSNPFIFHSPFPKGNKFWYPDVKSNYAMLFDQPDADFIHDAPWRNKFGPGTNGPGIPGQVYTGSHGCVETPESVWPRLFTWTATGTPVVITQ